MRETIVNNRYRVNVRIRVRPWYAGSDTQTRDEAEKKTHCELKSEEGQGVGFEDVHDRRDGVESPRVRDGGLIFIDGSKVESRRHDEVATDRALAPT